MQSKTTPASAWGAFKAVKLHWLVLVSVLGCSEVVAVLLYGTCELV